MVLVFPIILSWSVALLRCRQSLIPFTATAGSCKLFNIYILVLTWLVSTLRESCRYRGAAPDSDPVVLYGGGLCLMVYIRRRIQVKVPEGNSEKESITVVEEQHSGEGLLSPPPIPPRSPLRPSPSSPIFSMAPPLHSLWTPHPNDRRFTTQSIPSIYSQSASFYDHRHSGRPPVRVSVPPRLSLDPSRMTPARHARRSMPLSSSPGYAASPLRVSPHTSYVPPGYFQQTPPSVRYGLAV